MLVFEERGKPEYRENNLLVQSNRTNKLDPHMSINMEFGNLAQTTLVGGEYSHHCAILAPIVFQ